MYLFNEVIWGYIINWLDGRPDTTEVTGSSPVTPTMIKLFLDDVRNPWECKGYMYSRIGAMIAAYDTQWMVVRNFDEFVKAVNENAGHITHVSFDHDLADGHYHESMDNGKEAYEQHLLNVKEKTGYECAMYLKELYDGSVEDDGEGFPLPMIFIHTMNPVGYERIESVFKPRR